MSKANGTYEDSTAQVYSPRITTNLSTNIKKETSMRIFRREIVKGIERQKKDIGEGFVCHESYA